MSKNYSFDHHTVAKDTSLSALLKVGAADAYVSDEIFCTFMEEMQLKDRYGPSAFAGVTNSRSPMIVAVDDIGAFAMDSRYRSHIDLNPIPPRSFIIPNLIMNYVSNDAQLVVSLFLILCLLCLDRWRNFHCNVLEKQNCECHGRSKNIHSRDVFDG